MILNSLTINNHVTTWLNRLRQISTDTKALDVLQVRYLTIKRSDLLLEWRYALHCKANIMPNCKWPPWSWLIRLVPILRPWGLEVSQMSYFIVIPDPTLLCYNYTWRCEWKLVLFVESMFWIQVKLCPPTLLKPPSPPTMAIVEGHLNNSTRCLHLQAFFPTKK